MAVVLADVLDETQVVLELRGQSLDDALHEIAGTMKGGSKLHEPDKFVAQAVARERTMTTFVGNGVAFPHARTDLVAQIVLGIGRSQTGIPFSNEDRAQLIFLIAVPRRMVTDYLVCVGALARLTRDETKRAALMNAATEKELIEILREGSLVLE